MVVKTPPAADAVILNSAPSLDGMVGLDALKKMISSIKTGADYRNVMSSMGAKLDAGFQNALIAGAHGTGKTTFAKILAFEYRAAGIIPNGAPILFIDGVALAGEYIGQSEERTRRLLNSALEGIIIIDEIDSLIDIPKFGPSVLNTLNAHMGNAINAPIIIATCYMSRKEELLRMNRGLEGRFHHTMHMPEYDIDDLADMFVKKVHTAGLICDHGVRNSVKETLMQAKKGKGSLFANAREIQNIFDATIEAHAARLTQHGICFSRQEGQV